MYLHRDLRSEEICLMISPIMTCYDNSFNLFNAGSYAPHLR